MPSGTAVPVMVGSATLVMSSPGTPLSLAGASVRPAGAAGTPVSRVTTSASEGAETLATKSVSVAVRLLAPSLSGTVATIDQVPAWLTMPVPISVSPS